MQNLIFKILTSATKMDKKQNENHLKCLHFSRHIIASTLWVDLNHVDLFEKDAISQ